jgi:hypothetical protein
MIDVSELQSMLDALKRAKYAGLRRVQFTDRLVEYNSIDDMRKAQSAFTLATHSRD